MTVAIAAAGTGGHVYPGLAVGEALVAAGVAPSDVLYLGGDRLESEVYPAAGFPFEEIRIRGFQRGQMRANLRLPALVWRARRRAISLLSERGVRVVLGLGNYITVPVAMAARRLSIPFFIHEQNAHPGLANRLVSPWAQRSFVSFPDTPRLHRVEVTGNPLRAAFWDFSRDDLQAEARQRYGLEAGMPTVGVFGGSLGARALNQAVAQTVRTWSGSDLQVLHLVGRSGADHLPAGVAGPTATWVVREFEERMDLFYAACDLVVARAGGGIAELLATATPSVLVPGGFGSEGHQAANARYVASSGAAVIVPEDELEGLAATVKALIEDPDRRSRMADAARRIARPDAAATIAGRMLDAAHG